MNITQALRLLPTQVFLEFVNTNVPAVTIAGTLAEHLPDACFFGSTDVPATIPAPPPPAPKARKPRPAKVASADALARVTAAFGLNPTAKLRDLAASLELPPADVGAALARLLAEGHVRQDGKGRGTVYTWA